MRIFISYRRADSRSFTERIADYLADEFGQDNIFQDVDDIPAGEDFRAVLRDAVATCDVVLVVIGRQWLSVTDESERRRIDNPNDFVRIEVEAALTQGKLVVPLLVDNATPPDDSALPEAIRELAYRNAAPVRYNPDFGGDMTRLKRRLRTFERDLEAQLAAERARAAAPPPVVVEAPPPPAPPPPAPNLRGDPLPMTPLPVITHDAAVQRSRQTAAKIAPLRALIVHIAAIGLTAAFVFPLVWALVTSFRTIEDGDSVGWSISSASATALGSSLLVAVLVGVVSLIIAVPTGYGWARLSRGRTRRNVMALLLLPRLIPPIVILIPIFLLLRATNLWNTVPGLVIANATLALPFATWVMGETFTRLIGAEMTDAVPSITQMRRLTGSEQGRAAMLAALAVGFIVGWQEYLFALVLSLPRDGRAIMVEVALRRTDFNTLFPETAALSLITGLVTALVVTLLARRYLARWFAPAGQGEYQ